MPRSMLFALTLMPLAIGFATPEVEIASVPATESTHPVVQPYVSGGVGFYELQQGDYSTFAYAIGAKYKPFSWLGLDAGFLDLGEVDTGSIPAFGIPEFGGGDYGQYTSTRLGYAIPTLELRFGRISIEGGIGLALVESRWRTYNSLRQNAKVAAAAQEFSSRKRIAKIGVRWRASKRWTIALDGLDVDVDGYSSAPDGPDVFGYKNRAVMLGLAYSPGPSSEPSGAWSFSLGPSFSRLSFHDNYHTTPTGYDFSVRRVLARNWTAEIGYTEFGESRARPRRADGGYILTWPYDEATPDPYGDLLIKSGTTYGLVGLQGELGSRLAAGIAVGAGFTRISFMSISPVYPVLPLARYTERVDRAALLAQGRAQWSFGKGWSVGITARYTEFDGVQITSQEFEPDFGNTNVRTWSFIPSLVLSF